MEEEEVYLIRIGDPAEAPGFQRTVFLRAPDKESAAVRLEAIQGRMFNHRTMTMQPVRWPEGGRRPFCAPKPDRFFVSSA